jgi:hypothetical protein
MEFKQKIIIGTILTAIIAFIITYLVAVNGITQGSQNLLVNTSAPIVADAISTDAIIIGAVFFVVIIIVGFIFYLKFD